MSVERAHALLELGRPEEALATLAELGPDADGALAHGVRAMALIRLGRLREAGSAAAQARAADPAGELGHRLGAVVALRNGELRRSAAFAAEAVRLDPGERAAHHMATLALLELGDLPGAERHADEVLRLAPDEALSHQTKARVLMAQRRPADAEAALRRSLALDPQDDDSMALLAEVTAKLGRHVEAADLRLSALRANPQEARHQRGLLARGGRVAGGFAGIGLAKAFGLALVIRVAAHLPGLGGTVLGLVVAAYVAAFVVSRRRRARRGRELPALVWQGLRPTRRNADLQWLAWPAGLVVLVMLPAAALAALRGGAPGASLVPVAASLLVLAGCWLLRAGNARNVRLGEVARAVPLAQRYLWEQLQAARERRQLRRHVAGQRAGT